MDTEKENNIRLLLQAQLQQEFGKARTDHTTPILASLLAMSAGINVLLGYGVYLYRDLWAQCMAVLS